MTRDLVLDASAALEAVLGRSKAGAVLDFIETANSVRAPELYSAEVANALWKHVRAGDLDLERAQKALRMALDLIDSTIPSRELAEEALATAAAYDHPVYDTLYAITARRIGATVCTLDRRLAALLKQARISVELI